MNSLEILLTFVQTLSHKIRTPLSVVTNDLQYFDRINKELLADKTLNKANLISDILSDTEENILKLVLSGKNKLEDLLIVIQEILTKEDNWQVVAKTPNSLEFAFTKSINLPIEIKNCGILDFYRHILGAESLNIIALELACRSFLITQNFQIENNKVIFTFYK